MSRTLCCAPEVPTLAVLPGQSFYVCKNDPDAPTKPDRKSYCCACLGMKLANSVGFRSAGVEASSTYVGSYCLRHQAAINIILFQVLCRTKVRPHHVASYSVLFLSVRNSASGFGRNFSARRDLQTACSESYDLFLKPISPTPC